MVVHFALNNNNPPVLKPNAHKMGAGSGDWIGQPLHLNIELESEGGGVVAWTVIRRGAAGRDGGSEGVEVAPAPLLFA
jgi:hypothetical protein